MSSGKASRNYQLLELEDGASWADVELAYRRLLRRYEPGCLPSYGLLRVKERHKLLMALKDAYEQLRRSSNPPSGAPPAGGDQEAPEPQHPSHAAELNGSDLAFATVQAFSNHAASEHTLKSHIAGSSSNSCGS